MLKKFSKILLLTLLLFTVLFSSMTCFAHEEDESTTSTTDEETSTSDETTATEPEIHYGDLYLFDDDIVMDKYVDGNVFIFGNNVEITGTVNGNLFVFANNVSFNGSLIRYSIFTFANSVYYNGGTYESDLYVAANSLEMTYDSYVARDVKAICSTIIFKSAIGRDADLLCNTIDFGTGNDVSVIYGDLRYTANNEVEIPDGVIAESGSVTYTRPSDVSFADSSITDILMGFATCVVTALALYIILNKLTPKFMEKTSSQKFSVVKLLKAFCIGFGTIIIVSIFFILLLGTYVGAKLAIILALLFAILCIIAIPTLTISITNKLKPILKIEKTSMFYFVLVLVSIILYGITLIPFVGSLLGFIIKVTSIGLVINIYLPHKELSDEEISTLKEAKKQAKEKSKQEKIEAKSVKKQQKLEAKEAKKKDKEI